MKAKLADYVHQFFEDLPKTHRATELEDELAANLCDKFDDLVGGGLDENTAYERVIASIGDIGELILPLSRPGAPYDEAENQKNRKKSAKVVSVCIGLYILSLISIAIGTYIAPENDLLSLLLFMVIAGAASCILVYHFLSRPKYQRVDDTLLEDFKEWKSTHSKHKKLRGAVISVIWSVSLVLYFVFSFAIQDSWSYSWIIFLVAILATNIVAIWFSMDKKQ